MRNAGVPCDEESVSKATMERTGDLQFTCSPEDRTPSDPEEDLVTEGKCFPSLCHVANLSFCFTVSITLELSFDYFY